MHTMLKVFRGNYFLVEGLLRKVIEKLPMIIKPDQANIFMVSENILRQNICINMIENHQKSTTLLLSLYQQLAREE
jgi:hypothetical protein